MDWACGQDGQEGMHSEFLQEYLLESIDSEDEQEIQGYCQLKTSLRVCHCQLVMYIIIRKLLHSIFIIQWELKSSYQRSCQTYRTSFP
jgi:hypothetical protein